MNRAVALITIAVILLTPIVPFTNIANAQVVQVNAYYIDVIAGYWYAINTGGKSYRVFYYDSSGNSIYLSVYRWDADPNYIVFQSPCNCRLFLVEEPYTLQIIDTKSWFSIPRVNISTSSATSMLNNRILASNILGSASPSSTTYIFNGTALVLTRKWTVSERRTSGLYPNPMSSWASAGATYSFTINIVAPSTCTVNTFTVSLNSPAIYFTYTDMLVVPPQTYRYIGIIDYMSVDAGSGFYRVYYYTFSSGPTLSGRTVTFTLSSSRLEAPNAGSASSVMLNYTYTADITCTQTRSVNGNLIVFDNGNKMYIYTLSQLATIALFRSSTAYVFYLYTQKISLYVGQIETQSVSMIVVPLDTTYISGIVKSPIPASFIEGLSIWTPTWIINYGSSETFIVFASNIMPRETFNVSIVYNYPVRYVPPTLNYRYTYLDDVIALFPINGTVKRTAFEGNYAMLINGTIFLGTMLGSSILFRIDAGNTKNLVFQGVEHGWINTSSTSYLSIYVYDPNATVSGTLAAYSALVIENTRILTTMNVLSISTPDLVPWPLNLITYVVSGNIVGSWAYRVPIYISLSELPAYVSESGFVFRLELPLQDWIRAGLLSPGLEDLMFTDTASQPLLFYVYDASKGIVYVRYNAPIVTQTIVIYVLLKNPSLWGSGRTFSTLAVFDKISPRDFVDDFGYNVYTTYLAYNAMLVVTTKSTAVKFGKTWYDFVSFNASMLWEQHGSLPLFSTALSNSFEDSDELLIYINRQDYDNVLVYRGSKPLFSFKLSDYSSNPCYYIGYKDARAVYVFRMLMYSYSVGQLVGGYPQPQQIAKPTTTAIAQQNVQIDWWSMLPIVFIIVVLGLVVKWLGESQRPAPQKPINLP